MPHDARDRPSPGENEEESQQGTNSNELGCDKQPHHRAADVVIIGAHKSQGYQKNEFADRFRRGQGVEEKHSRKSAFLYIEYQHHNYGKEVKGKSDRENQQKQPRDTPSWFEGLSRGEGITKQNLDPLQSAIRTGAHCGLFH